MEFYSNRYFLLIILPIVLFFLMKKAYKRKNKALELLELKKTRSYYKYLNILGIILLIIALAGPRVLKDREKVELVGTDIYVLIDVSKSMLAEDVLPNRLTKGKEEIRDIIKGLRGDRIGFIPFTNDAYIQMPLTDDYDMALMYLDVIDTDLLYSGGTDFAKGIDLATESFKKSSQGKKIIVIVSDGEDHGEAIKVDDKDTYIYSIGVGTEKGSVIPIDGGFITDDRGNIVVSKLEKEILKQLASKGKYFDSNNVVSGSEGVLRSIEMLERSSTREEEVEVYKEYFVYPLLLGLLLLMLAYYLEERFR